MSPTDFSDFHRSFALRMPRPTSERLIQHSTPHIQHYKTTCPDFWLKTCVGILREPERQTALFAECYHPKWSQRLPLAIFRTTKHAKPRHERQAIVLPLGIFRIAKRHLSQRQTPKIISRTSRQPHNHLTTNLLQKCAENRVFAPNLCLAKNKRVVFAIDCYKKLPLTPTACSAPRVTYLILTSSESVKSKVWIGEK